MSITDEIFGPQLLNEAVSDIVYHMTRSPIEIFKSNELLGNYMMREPRLRGKNAKKKGWFISTTRSLSSTYLTWLHSGASTIFELDGRKISQRYSGGPIDYWHAAPDPETGEMEDRIWIEEESLRPLSQYVRRVIVPVAVTKKNGVLEHLDSNYGEYVNKIIKAALKYNKDLGVPVLIVPISKENRRVSNASLRRALSREEIGELLSSVSAPSEDRDVGAESYPWPASSSPREYAEWWGKDGRHINKENLIAAILHYHYLGWLPKKIVEKMEMSSDVRLTIYSDGDFPERLIFNNTNGIWGDYRDTPKILHDEFTRVLQATGYFAMNHDDMHAARRDWFVNFLYDPSASAEDNYVTTKDAEPDWAAVEEHFTDRHRYQIDFARMVLAQNEGT